MSGVPARRDGARGRRAWPSSSSASCSRVYQREERLADILDLPWGEKDVDLDAAVEQHSSLVENTIGVAGRLIDQVDAEGSFLTLLERSRLPVRPGEFALLVMSFAVIVGCLVTAVTTSVLVRHRRRRRHALRRPSPTSSAGSPGASGSSRSSSRTR